MSLRMRLTWALVVAALGPMLIVVVVTLLRTEQRAEQDAAQRLEAAKRQARILLDRNRDDATSRLEAAADDLSHDLFALESLLGRPAPHAETGGAGPDASPGRLEIARTLAVRHGLDHLEILDGKGMILANSRMDAQAGLRSELAGLEETGAVERALPAEGFSVDGAGRGAVLSRRAVAFANAPFFVAGGLVLDRRLLDGIAAITGGPAALIDPSGRIDERATWREGSTTAEPAAGARNREDGEDAGRGNRISGEVPVGDGGWKVRVTAPAADVERARRELLAIVLGIAPFALATALLLGIVLAQGVSRPIRALAARAEEISAQQAAPIHLHPDTDEVRRLTVAFDQMLDALARSEQRRVSAERIAAWQEVARRIAHEVKNPLSPIKLAVENLRRTREKAPGELDRALEVEGATILEEVESLRRLVDEFSQFARLPAPQLAPCDPRAIIASSLALVGGRIEARGVAVEVDGRKAPATIRADAEQIGRALKNVLLNALDAMETVAEPRLRIVLSGAEDPPRGSESGTEPPDPGTEGDEATETRAIGFLRIVVQDSGVGIEPSALRRIFEPYFTTRPERGGAGLGMAITHRIVFEHGGTIHAASTTGRGTTITILLPVAGPPAAAS